ncbi:small-conductance calcium-activated potassium channel protein [Stylonychia lemnae]|uniref:Small-conductance calcium-activated potassium channel protein n=1 Tax=Stylonychia lemnae TaxID=5949 RepID=A0A077ZP80_STYLE|nr:small-conductance calcium-activated potassium channel protein [Stylonychia lemnae]|eukprot:CDW71264.1 small-conductance calcium-activated potassium channel protein [Stylonychia lemnae]
MQQKKNSILKPRASNNHLSVNQNGNTNVGPKQTRSSVQVQSKKDPTNQNHEVKYEELLDQISHRSIHNQQKLTSRAKKSKFSKKRKQTDQNSDVSKLKLEQDQDISQQDQSNQEKIEADQKEEQEKEIEEEKKKIDEIFEEESFGEEEQDAELFEHNTGLDIRVSNELFNKIKLAEYASVFFSTYGVFLSILLYEMKDQENIEEYQNMILAYNCMCTSGLIFSIYSRHDIMLKWQISRGLLTEFDTISNTGWWKGMIYEMVINSVAPYPFLYRVKYDEYIDNGSFKTTVTYDVNDLLLFFCFIRVYHVIRYSLVMTQFMNPRSQRVCSMNGCEANAMFAIKSIMKQKPYTILWTSMVVSTLIFGYQLRIFEGPVSEASGQNFKSMINSMWNVLITLTTVGYGDIYPKSLMGRVVGVIVCFWGVFIVSFFVVTLNNMLTFSPNEEKSYNLLLRLYYKEQLKLKATQVLSSAFKQKNVKFKEPDNRKKILSSIRNFRKYMIDFQQTARTVRSFYEADTDVEIMQKLIENLMDDVTSLRDQQDQMNESLSKIEKFITQENT